MRAYFESDVGIGASISIRPRTIEGGRESAHLPEEIRDHVLRIKGDKDVQIVLTMNRAELDALADAITQYRDHVKGAGQ